MAIYLIDYENVSVDGLKGVTKLTDDDSVCIFYSENRDRLTFGLHRRLCESNAKIEYIKIKLDRKNALDFYIASKVGEIFATDKNAKVLEEKSMGQRELAYEINKFKTGYYYLFVVEAKADAVKEFDRVARINESLLRHLVVKVED